MTLDISGMLDVRMLGMYAATSSFEPRAVQASVICTSS